MKAVCWLASIALWTASNAQSVTRNGLSFELNGSPFAFAGANSWDIGFYDRQHISATLNNAKQAALPVLRVAAWNMKDVSHNLQPGANFFEEWNGGSSTINYGPTGLQLLDSAVQQAEDQGIKYIMCLTNNWIDYGGMPIYVDNLVGDGASQTNFYNNPTVINQFKSYVAAIVSRYKDSSAIFAWELANEARCQSSDCGGTSVLTQWASDISDYIKTLDSTHMITFGGVGNFDEGTGAHNYDFAYDGQSGESFSAILALPNIDFGTVHLYTNSESGNNDGPDYGMQWLKDHNDAAVQAGKPMIVEELGVNRTDPNLSQSAVLKQYENYMSSGDAAAIQGGMLWSCDITSGEPNVPACPVPEDPYAICAGTSDFTDLVTNFAGAMSAKGKSE